MDSPYNNLKIISPVTDLTTSPVAHASLGGAELNGSAVYSQVSPRDQRLVSADAEQYSDINSDSGNQTLTQNHRYVTWAFINLSLIPRAAMKTAPSLVAPPGPDQQPKCESIELATKDTCLKGEETAMPEQDTKLDGDQHYAVPAQESESTCYSKLRHSPGGVMDRTVRLAAIPDSGYETLPQGHT